VGAEKVAKNLALIAAPCSKKCFKSGIYVTCTSRKISRSFAILGCYDGYAQETAPRYAE
jgi:hypothetical protein